MSNFTDKGARKRSYGGRLPDLPAMPAPLQEDPAMREWNEKLQETWHKVREQFDKLEENLRTAIAEANQ